MHPLYFSRLEHNNIRMCLSMESETEERDANSLEVSPLVQKTSRCGTDVWEGQKGLLLDHIRIRAVEQALIHSCLSFSGMITVALTVVRQHKPNQIRSKD